MAYKEGEDKYHFRNIYGDLELRNSPNFQPYYIRVARSWLWIIPEWSYYYYRIASDVPFDDMQRFFENHDGYNFFWARATKVEYVDIPQSQREDLTELHVVYSTGKDYVGFGLGFQGMNSDSPSSTDMLSKGYHLTKYYYTGWPLYKFRRGADSMNFLKWSNASNGWIDEI